MLSLPLPLLTLSLSVFYPLYTHVDLDSPVAYADVRKQFKPDADLKVGGESVPVPTALIKARFPSLLPYLTPRPGTVPPITSSSSLPPLPLSRAAADTLVSFILKDEAQLDKLNITDVTALLSFAEQSGSVSLKAFCAKAFSQVDLTKLSNLGETMIAAYRFGLIQLERFEYLFLSVLHLSLSFLANHFIILLHCYLIQFQSSHTCQAMSSFIIPLFSAA